MRARRVPRVPTGATGAGTRRRSGSGRAAPTGAVSPIPRAAPVDQCDSGGTRPGHSRVTGADGCQRTRHPSSSPSPLVRLAPCARREWPWLPAEARSGTWWQGPCGELVQVLEDGTAEPLEGFHSVAEDPCAGRRAAP